MSKEDVFKESTQVIQEIEEQLEKILQKKVSDIDRDLEGRILQEKESAERKKEEVEKDIKRERDTLSEYRTLIQETEAERSALLNDIREHSKKILHFQGEIENLAKSTADEIKVVNDIQRKLEDLRQKTADRAAFLKNDLRERFGIIAEVPEEREEPLKMDLELELEKLRKIKELLAMESAEKISSGTEPIPDESSPLEEASPPPAEEEPQNLEVPDIPELIESSDDQGAETNGEQTEAVPAEPEKEEGEAENDAVAEAFPAVDLTGEPSDSDEELLSALEPFRKSEPANGSGEIHYFQHGDKALIDGERLFGAIENTLEETQRLSDKLNLTESPKDQFFIKQELINWQESLRALLLRIIKMSEKKSWTLPRFTADILSVQCMRDLLERLSMENWSNPEEFVYFRDSVKELRSSYLSRIRKRADYLRSLKEELESD